MNRAGFFQRIIGVMLAGFVTKDVVVYNPGGQSMGKTTMGVRVYKRKDELFGRSLLDDPRIIEGQRQRNRISRELLDEAHRDMLRRMPVNSYRKEWPE